MARAIDRAGIQFRTLNASKGAAVRATRAQADRELYKAAIQALISEQQNLSIVEQSVADLVVLHVDRQTALDQLEVQKPAFDHVTLVPKRNNEVAKPALFEVLHDVPENGPSTDVDHRFRPNERFF